MVTLIALFEAIEQTLRRDAEEAIEPVAKAWARRRFRDLLEQAGLADLREQMRAARRRDPDGEEAEDIRNAAEDKLDELRHGLFDTGNTQGVEMVEEVRDLISRTLSDVARAHIERTLGDIEPYDDATDRQNIGKGIEKNLYWLSHIVVHLKGDSSVGPEDLLSHAGGYFTRNLGQRGDFQDSKHAATLDHDKDLSVGIAIRVKDSDFASMVSYLLSDEAEIELHGEVQAERSGGTPAMHCLGHALDTFVHEVVHLEQDSRERMVPTGKRKGSGLTYLPKGERPKSYDSNKGPPRGSDRKNPHAGMRTYRPGKRGNPSHLSASVNTTADYASYFGSAHEIEAHAAGAASAMIAAILAEMRSEGREGDTPEERQANLNAHIDEEIASLQAGQTYNDSASLRSYTRFAKDLIGSIERKVKLRRDSQGDENPSRRRYPLPKVDELHRKVWRLFMTKVVRHLLAYRRDIAWGEDEYGAEMSPQPRAARVGGITHPAKRPTLPNS